MKLVTPGLHVKISNSSVTVANLGTFDFVPNGNQMRGAATRLMQALREAQQHDDIMYAEGLAAATQLLYNEADLRFKP